MSESQNNKRVAKNTLFLYLRMLITLFIGLFTSRVVLQTLGVHDYGLYNVVGGIIGILAYANNLLGQGTTRFLTIDLGNGNLIKLKNTFSACVSIHLLLALITFLIGETIGLWFVNTHLVINPTRIDAANWVYQLSLLSGVLAFMQVPYSASIIAHEKMSIYAYMSIFDVCMKLLIVYLLLFIPFDKLKLYSTFYFIVNIINITIYRIYCHKFFPECRFHINFDWKLYKEIFNYVGWNSIGTFAFMANSQGINVLLNLFYSTVVNAARGIAFTVSGVINQFVSNFQTAITPQVLKYYAQGNILEMNRLVKNNAQYSSYLVFLFGLPVFLETEFLIKLWLGQIPEYVIPFIRLTIIQILVQAIDTPIGGGIHAYGKMKLPNLTTSFVYLSVLPLSYIAMKLGASPIITYIIIVLLYPVALIFDLWILKKYSGFSIMVYVKDVIFKGIYILFLSATIPSILSYFLPYGVLRFIIVTSISVLSTIITVYYIGLTTNVRIMLINKIKSKVRW